MENVMTLDFFKSVEDFNFKNALALEENKKMKKESLNEDDDLDLMFVLSTN